MCVRAFGIFLHSYTTQTYIYFFSFFCCCCCSILTATAADINNSNQSNNFYCCCWRFQLLCQRPEYKHTLVDIICTNVRVFVCVCASCMLDPQHPCRHVNMTIAVFPSVHLLMLFFSFAFFSPHACIYFYLFVVFCVDQRLPRHADADTLQSLIVIVAIWCGQINCNAFYFPIPGFNLPPDAPLNKVRRIWSIYIYAQYVHIFRPSAADTRLKLVLMALLAIAEKKTDSFHSHVQNFSFSYSVHLFNLLPEWKWWRSSAE